MRRGLSSFCLFALEEVHLGAFWKWWGYSGLCQSHFLLHEIKAVRAGMVITSSNASIWRKKQNSGQFYESVNQPGSFFVYMTTLHCSGASLVFRWFIIQTVFKVCCTEKGVSKNEVWWPQPTMLWLLVVQRKIYLSHKSSGVSDIVSYHTIGFVLPIFLMVCCCESNVAVWENNGFFSFVPICAPCQNRKRNWLQVIWQSEKKMGNSYLRVTKIGLTRERLCLHSQVTWLSRNESAE